MRNKTDAGLSTVRLTRWPEDYQLEKVFLPGGVIAENDFQKQNAVLIPALAPGQLITIQGTLKPRATHKSEAVAVSLEWSQLGLPRQSATVPLGESQVRGWPESVLPWFFELFKSLAIPISVLIITLIITSSVKDRDARSETLKLMLPVIHKYSAKYYMPLSRAAGRAVLAINEAGKKLGSNVEADTTAVTQKSLFYVLLVKRVMDSTRAAIGGLYFKDLRGEKLAAEGLKKFDRLFGDETRTLSLAVQKTSATLEINSSYESFAVQCNAGTNAALLSEFKSWLGDEEKRKPAMCLLAAINVVLDYETNRPYTYWYDWIDKLNPVFKLNDEKNDEKLDLTPTIDRLAADAGIGAQDLKEYLASK